MDVPGIRFRPDEPAASALWLPESFARLCLGQQRHGGGMEKGASQWITAAAYAQHRSLLLSRMLAEWR